MSAPPFRAFEPTQPSAHRFGRVEIGRRYSPPARRVELDADGWEAWQRCSLRLLRSGTGTRA